MKPFFWKIVICLIPNLLAAGVVYHAYDKYSAGERGFRLGVDLVGGTILVYEVDPTKQALTSRDLNQKKDTLAAYLKKRIDPNDLQNIVIRMVGENRVEIILPTGGEHRAELARERWNKVLADVKADWKELKDDPKVFNVSQGKVDELAENIKKALDEKKWPRLLDNKEVWAKLVKEAKAPVPPQDEPLFDKVKRGQYQALIALLKNNAAVSRQAVDRIHSLAQTEAWKATLKKLPEELKKIFPDAGKLKLYSDKDDKGGADKSIPEFSPERRDQLINYIEGKGSPFAQAALVASAPLFPEDETAQAIGREIDELYGPSMQTITNSINKHYKPGAKKDLTSEEVEQIKEKIRRVGKLEFLILANDVDDKKDEVNGVDDAEKFLQTTVGKDKLDRMAKQGEPPPTPDKVYRITTAHDAVSRVGYRWVEMSPKYRKEMGLANRMEGSENWNKAARARNGVAQIGSHFVYSRECKDQRLTEEQRKDKKYEYFILAREPEIEGGRDKSITGAYLSSVRRGQDKYAKPCVDFTFDATGAQLFGELTGKNVPSDRAGRPFERQLAIVLDGLVETAPNLQSQINSSGQITGGRGGFTAEEVDLLVGILRSGALPATLKPQPVSESTMGATLGQDTIDAGVFAVEVAFLFVLVFMVIYYRFAGLVACVALLSNLLLTVGFMVAVQATFTLPGLAGLVLMLGMAVDANVLIYERLREERDRGASLALAIRNGYDRAFPTIIDTHLTSIFTAIVLYVVGNDQLKGFGVSLTVGLIISLFTSLYMTRLLFDIWQHKGWLKKLSMFRLLSKTRIDFMAIRYYWFTATILLTIIGVTVFLIRGKQGLNIDFVGGTAYGGKLLKPESLGELRGLLEEDRQKEMLAVEPGGVKELDGGRSYQITYVKPLDGAKTRIIGFANRPDLPTLEERIADVTKRAQELPDWSVEQIFLSSSGEAAGNRSDHFTVRTAEKEAKLVQTTLHRLLQEKGTGQKWHSLLDQITMDKAEIATPLTASKKTKENPKEIVHEATLRFSKPASPSFVSTLLTETMSKYKTEDGKAITFTVTGEGAGEESRFKVMNMSIPDGMKRADLKAVLATTKEQFNSQPQPERLENFDSALAAETQGRAILAIVLSWGAILLYLWLRFGNWTFGLATVLCLIHDLFFTVGILAFASYLHGTTIGNFLMFDDFKLDLNGVAALLTLVGYSVSDTIVVFDRIREVRGKNPELTPQMINDSVNQTLSRTLLTAFSVWLVVSVLYVIGGPGVHLFAFVMVVGVIVGTYSSIYIASPLLLIFGEGAPKAGRVRERQPKPVETTA